MWAGGESKINNSTRAKFSRSRLSGSSPNWIPSTHDGVKPVPRCCAMRDVHEMRRRFVREITTWSLFRVEGACIYASGRVLHRDIAEPGVQHSDLDYGYGRVMWYSLNHSRRGSSLLSKQSFVWCFGCSSSIFCICGWHFRSFVKGLADTMSISNSVLNSPHAVFLVHTTDRGTLHRQKPFLHRAS